jgi:hypothetical protein
LIIKSFEIAVYTIFDSTTASEKRKHQGHDIGFKKYLLPTFLPDVQKTIFTENYFPSSAMFLIEKYWYQAI